MGNLSEHFDNKDFRCDCGCGWEGVSPKLVCALEKLNNRIEGHQLQIISGLRCKNHSSANLGGPAEMHQDGKAADIFVPMLDPAKVFTESLLVPEFGGVGLYPASGRIHVDVRPNRVVWVEDEGKTRYFHAGSVF